MDTAAHEEGGKMGGWTRRAGVVNRIPTTVPALRRFVAAAGAIGPPVASHGKGLVIAACISLAFLAAGRAGDAWSAEEEPEYLGVSDCLDCHEELEQPFSRNVHSKSSYWREKAYGCEDCHGPGSVHAESDGDVRLGYPTDLMARQSNAVCLSCHDGDRSHTYWRGSVHEVMDVSCVSCHAVHANHENMLNSRSEPETCFGCHKDQRSYAFKRSRHPLTDATRKSGLGKMKCSSCHNPHGSQSAKLISAHTVNAKCYECHREKEAPVLFEHSPVKENCLNCHDAHGSNYPDMLTLDRTRLCQSCHGAGSHPTLAGQVINLRVSNRECGSCHTRQAQVHGSNYPAGLKRSDR